MPHLYTLVGTHPWMKYWGTCLIVLSGFSGFDHQMLATPLSECEGPAQHGRRKTSGSHQHLLTMFYSVLYYTCVINELSSFRSMMLKWDCKSDRPSSLHKMGSARFALEVTYSKERKMLLSLSARSLSVLQMEKLIMKLWPHPFLNAPMTPCYHYESAGWCYIYPRPLWSDMPAQLQALPATLCLCQDQTNHHRVSMCPTNCLWWCWYPSWQRHPPIWHIPMSKVSHFGTRDHL